MAYDIKAWLDREGSPRLEILDAESGTLRMAWDAREHRSQAIKSLFHELMLLSLRDQLVDSAGVSPPR